MLWTKAGGWMNEQSIYCCKMIIVRSCFSCWATKTKYLKLEIVVLGWFSSRGPRCAAKKSNLFDFDFKFLNRMMTLSFLNVKYFVFCFYFFVYFHSNLLDLRFNIDFYCLNYLGNNSLANAFFNWNNLIFLRSNYF